MLRSGIPARERTLSSIAANLPAAVVAALEAGSADPGTRATTAAAGIPWSSIAWGDPADRPLLLIHGVSASARIWWRVGPALAATGRRVSAVDLPGHGRTGHWLRHHRFRDAAVDLAGWIRAAGLASTGLQVVGHSYGAMTAAALPGAGIRPATLVLLDPPAVPLDQMVQMAGDLSERPNPQVAEAAAILAAANPRWPTGDVEAKAEALVQLEVEAARAILTENGDWDGGLAELRDPASSGIPTWIIRGDPEAGGLIPDARLPALEAAVGAGHLITLIGAPHAPQRTHATELVAALLRALG
jgi:pimeloyl-ACP methyl ester carboxylesterase